MFICFNEIPNNLQKLYQVQSDILNNDSSFKVSNPTFFTTTSKSPVQITQIIEAGNLTNIEGSMNWRNLLRLRKKFKLWKYLHFFIFEKPATVVRSSKVKDLTIFFIRRVEFNFESRLYYKLHQKDIINFSYYNHTQNIEKFAVSLLSFYFKDSF